MSDLLPPSSQHHTALLAVADLLRDLPDPTELKRTVKLRVQEAYAACYAARGEVLRQEDTYELQRQLQAVAEAFSAFAAGFTEVVKVVRQLQQEELVEAVGEQDGIPISGVTIPTAGGDIVVKPAFKRENAIDAGSVQAAIVKGVSEAWDGPIRDTVRQWPEKVTMDLQEMLAQALTALVGTGKWEPQITKLKATAEEWARAGRDDMAADLLRAHKVTQTYQDKVEVTRKAPK